jgi:hypothetical protein
VSFEVVLGMAKVVDRVFLYFRQVLEVIAAIKGENIDELCDTFYTNTEKLFFSR